jgi:hypothetical protein
MINFRTSQRDSIAIEPERLDALRSSLRGSVVFDALTPHATGGVDVNFTSEDETQRVAAGAYGPNYERLSQLKSTYDPDNLFCLNQNIAPQGRGTAR